jgi:isopentenyl phosphate kinase
MDKLTVSHSDVVFLKLGGSLITDKTRAYTPRPDIIRHLANDVHQALDTHPDLRLLIGHGSGSFGHWAAKPHGTRQGVHTSAQWRGYAEVAAAAARLNRIVTDTFLKADVPALSIQPSASARCHDYTLTYLDTRPIHAAFGQGLVPLVHGDVALDDVHGGTIISTEDIFLYLTDELHPARILLLGEVDGVLAPDGNVVPFITPDNFPTLQQALAGSAGVDVTGGMLDKVTRMVQLIQHHPKTSVLILPGTTPELLTQALLNTAPPIGTLITAD